MTTTTARHMAPAVLILAPHLRLLSWRLIRTAGHSSGGKFDPTSEATRMNAVLCLFGGIPT